MDMRITFHHQRGLVVAQIMGDVGVMAAHHLRTLLSRSLSLSARGLVIDLTRVELLDPAGLAVLVGLSRSAKTHHKSMTVIAGPRLRRMLHAAHPELAAEGRVVSRALPSPYPHIASGPGASGRRESRVAVLRPTAGSEQEDRTQRLQVTDRRCVHVSGGLFSGPPGSSRESAERRLMESRRHRRSGA
jgi:anti-anti-sigma factor